MRFGATILDAEGTRLSADEKALFSDVKPFGFILFARNVESGDQLRALCDDFREAAGHDCLITIDQEGGRVQRICPPLARQWQPPLDHVRLSGKSAQRSMYLRYRLIAEELRGFGIDSNCAPLADIASEATHPFLQNRCYATDLDTVVEVSRATAFGHLDGGILPIVKHMPGHGRAVSDSHFAPPQVDTDLETLRETDFAAFRRLSDLPLAMTGHVVFTDIDDKPATLSPKVNQIIRDDIGFDGLLMTDDSSMKALSGSPSDISKGALKAGCDLVLYCNADLKTRAEVAEAAGELGSRGLERAERALSLRKTPAPLDIQAAEDELSALMSGQVYG